MVEVVDKYCYLGIVFDRSGNFKTAINELRKKSLRALFGLKRVINKHVISFDSLLKLFDYLIKPILLYGCQVIFPNVGTIYKLTNENVNDNDYYKSISTCTYEKFHLKFLKWCCSIHGKSSNIGVWGDTGRHPIVLNALKLSVDYFQRVKNSAENTLLKNAFDEQELLGLDWFTSMNNLTDKFGTGKFKQTSINVAENMKIKFVQFWHRSKYESPKLDFYNLVKNDFKREEYLKLTNSYHRASITKLRISAHKLNIETGRYTTPLTQEKIESVIIAKMYYKIRT